MQRKRSPHSGFITRHSRRCPSLAGSACSCRPSYQARIWSARDGKRITKTFPTLAAAKAWRVDAVVAIRKGTMRAPTNLTLGEAADAWLAGATEGSIRNRSGDRYKPSAARGYEQALRLRVLPELGRLRIAAITRNDLQDLADRLVASGIKASTVRNTFLPVRAIYGRAVKRGEVALNPTLGLDLPAVRGTRERIASPVEAAALLVALPEAERALWATALYAGLRAGELQALAWDDVDLNACLIRVERGWDPKVGPIEPKSRAGKRRVPIPGVLRGLLLEHRLRQGNPTGLVFGRSTVRPFNPRTAAERAQRAWRAADLAPIGLHECRHTYASLMIAAGANAKALTTFMGHASVTVTYDRYGHLMPGSRDESAALLDAYLARSAG
jgi:integrase